MRRPGPFLNFESLVMDSWPVTQRYNDGMMNPLAVYLVVESDET